METTNRSPGRPDLAVVLVAAPSADRIGEILVSVAQALAPTKTITLRCLNAHFFLVPSSTGQLVTNLFEHGRSGGGPSFSSKENILSSAQLTQT